jgi:hypothetical protein
MNIRKKYQGVFLKGRWKGKKLTPQETGGYTSFWTQDWPVQPKVAFA